MNGKLIKAISKRYNYSYLIKETIFKLFNICLAGKKITDVFEIVKKSCSKNYL